MIWLPSTIWDIEHLADNLRQSDIDECTFNARAFGRLTPSWSIKSDMVGNFPTSDHWSLWHDEGLAAVGAITPLPDGRGAIWMLGTAVAERHGLGMTRACQHLLSVKLKEYRQLGNVVPMKMTDRIRWLVHLGFDIEWKQANGLPTGVVAFWSHF